MKFPKVIFGLVAVVAIALTACGGGDSKSSSTTTKATNPPVTTAAPETTPAPPTTVGVTTTTVPDYTYVVPVDTGIDGEHNTIIPDDGTYPFDAQNPDHPEALNLRKFSELPAGTKVCFHGGGGPGVDLTAAANGVALYQYKFGDMPEPLGYLALFVTDETGVWYWDAAGSGVINYPDGTWSETAWATLESC